MKKINCSAIPEQLLESQLFGHRKGAFTGATIAQKGIVELTDGGTLFLDEISQMKLELQPKLLRFLEDGTFLPVCETEERCSKTWVIAATNQNLEQLIDKNLFRSDLYYRLKGVAMTLPPLRERKDDILVLAQQFIEEFTHEFDLRPKKLSSQVQEMFISYHWPGNVRELRNIIREVIITAEGDLILPQHIQSNFFNNFLPGRSNKILSLADAEHEHIIKILHQNKGKIRKTARDLGITPQTLRKKMKRYGLDNIYNRG